MWAASQVVVTIASYMGWSSAIGGARWSMPVIPDEPGRLRRPGRGDEVVEGQPHLRQEQVELHDTLLTDQRRMQGRASGGAHPSVRVE